MRTALIAFLLTAPLLAQLSEPATHQKLIPTLWVQTAPEWRGLCLQTYRAATAALDRALKDKKSTAAVEQTGNFKKLKPAIILDIDETVLDNSPGQARQVITRTDFQPKEWHHWVQEQQAVAIPGAAEFCQYADRRKVKVFFVTNRDQNQKAATLANLKKAGFPTSPETLLCRGDRPEWNTSEKTARRQEIAKTYRILLLLGDDLGDFLPGVRTSIEQRATLVAPYLENWGRKWFLLPNPGYGSWEEALYAPKRAVDPTDRVRQKERWLQPKQAQ